MNRIIITLFLVFISICSFGQNGNHISDYIKMTETDSLYLTAFVKYTDELNSRYEIETEGNSEKIIYVQYATYLRLIPNKINGYKIQQLGLTNRKKHFRANNNKLILTEISPLTIRNGRFLISFIPYSTKLKSKKRINMSLSGWTNIYFKYVDGKLIYDETENGGI